MTIEIDEAIKHCEEVAEKKEKECKWISGSEDAGMNGALAKTFAECASEHRQLAEWLRELQNYQTAREEINQEIINWNDIDNGKVRGLFLAESIIAHYVDGGAE